MVEVFHQQYTLQHVEDHHQRQQSLLEARKPESEGILLGLGLGRPAYSQETGRIPQRFLRPSKLKVVTTDDFHSSTPLHSKSKMIDE